VQKIGRTGRSAELLGEAILYITSAAYIQYEVELDVLKGDTMDDDDDDPPPEQNPRVEGEQMDREAVVQAYEDEEQRNVPKKKSKKFMSAMEARDRRYLLEYIVTTECRRIPWNKFFGNASKCNISLFSSSV
jgi:superfamily II DNA/RNA helicase